MAKKKTTARVRSSREIGEGIMDLWLETDLAKDAKPGQFVAVYTKDASRLLPRPISGLARLFLPCLLCASCSHGA